ncbi:ribosomal protein L10-domain-containing protein [Mariannaea sp. PMI_226]|nr:ribosomal protein L10-domain-containing protein [Mariannaea sp. PMI_226]
MPKSKRAKVVHLTQVSKKTREDKDKLFQNIRDSIPEYQTCFVFSVDNMRNSYLKEVRRELSDSRLFFGKTKLMAKALGQTPAEAIAPGIDALSKYITGTVGLVLTNRPAESVLSYFENLAPVDFARAGVAASRDFSIPTGVVYATAGEVPAEHDVPLEHTIEPELRRLGVPTRMVKGRVVLGDEEGKGEEYVVCKEGDILDSRQTRLLKLFGVCLSEFKVQVVAYWNSATSEVTEVNPDAMNE